MSEDPLEGKVLDVPKPLKGKVLAAQIRQFNQDFTLYAVYTEVVPKVYEQGWEIHEQPVRFREFEDAMLAITMPGETRDEPFTYDGAYFNSLLGKHQGADPKYDEKVSKLRILAQEHDLEFLEGEEAIGELLGLNLARHFYAER